LVRRRQACTTAAVASGGDRRGKQQVGRADGGHGVGYAHACPQGWRGVGEPRPAAEQHHDLGSHGLAHFTTTAHIRDSKTSRAPNSPSPARLDHIHPVATHA
jgi:hypothetical protein